jgi:hypothetical protein
MQMNTLYYGDNLDIMCQKREELSASITMCRPITYKDTLMSFAFGITTEQIKTCLILY